MFLWHTNIIKAQFCIAYRHSLLFYLVAPKGAILFVLICPVEVVLEGHW